MIHPRARVHTHEPRAEWWVKGVLFDGVVITVSSEDLEKVKQKRKSYLFLISLWVNGEVSREFDAISKPRNA